MEQTFTLVDGIAITLDAPVAVSEGDEGVTSAEFTVKLSKPAMHPLVVHFYEDTTYNTSDSFSPVSQAVFLIKVLFSMSRQA